MKEVEFNANQYVKVKLTGHGHVVMSSFYLGRLSGMPHMDEHGYVKVQVWQLMRIFGEYMGLGKPPVFDMNMALCMEEGL